MTPLRLMIVCKRFPQQRDLLLRPYGRFHHLPVALAEQGHVVRVMLVSHHGLPECRAEAKGVQWSSLDLRLLGPRRLYHRLLEDAASFQPDWIVGFSDLTVGCLAARVARKLGRSLALDAYDDYEAYMPWNFPLHWLWRRSIQRADLVTAAGPQLGELLQHHRAIGSRPVEVIPMCADPAFAPMPKASARVALGLPAGAPLVGYSGGWARSRGTDVLVPALREVRRVRPDTLLVVTGSPPPRVVREPGVLSLGFLDDRQMPILMNAVDVACSIGTNSRFGRHSYPSKLCEAMACGTPVVASATDPVRWMLRQDPQWLVRPDSVADLAKRILENLDKGKVAFPPQQDWRQLGRRFAELLSVPRPAQ